MRILALIFILTGFTVSPASADMKLARDAYQAGKFVDAVADLIPAANSGNAEAEFLLGTIFTIGLGHPANPERGFDLYFRAASKGHPAAQMRVSHAYETGRGLAAADPVRALVWAELAKIGRADGARQTAAQLRGTLSDDRLDIVDAMVKDYRVYLFPFETQ